MNPSHRNKKITKKNKRNIVENQNDQIIDLDKLKDSDFIAEDFANSIKLLNENTNKQIYLLSEHMSKVSHEVLSRFPEEFSRSIKISTTSITKSMTYVIENEVDEITGSQEKYKTEKNGITEISSLKNCEILQDGQLKLEYDNEISTSDAIAITYNKVRTIETNVSFLLEQTQKQSQKEERLQYILKHNPFPYFQITSINYHPSKSSFLVNKEIVINLKPFSMSDNLCSVLFSGEQDLYDAWFEDSLREGWATFVDNEQADRLTWKQILTTVYSINNLFAQKTTIGDLIIVERPKKIRLNPKYFHRKRKS